MKKLITILLIAGSSYAVMGQEVKINTNLVVETDGTMRLDGAATVWDDLMVYPDATTRGSSQDPDWAQFKNNGSSSQGAFLWWFDSSLEEEVYFTVQIPHSYKVGTDILPHVHWTTSTGTPSASNVIWGLEYTVIAIGGSFPNTQIIYATNVISEIGTPTGTGQHLISGFPTISGTNFDISTVLVCRLFRAAGQSGDTFGNDTGLLGLDFHYEQNTMGSRTPWTK
jgi:hypothetical protein